MASNKPQPSDFIVQPTKQPHKQTFILLHGKGDVATDFGGGLLQSRIPGYGTLQSAFPHAKFIFPQAPLRRSARQSWVMTQWFDNWGYDRSGLDKEDLKIPGLYETTVMVHRYLREEGESLGGTENVVLGGLSQGSAASLIAILTWDGALLGGCLQMCGHLPFHRDIQTVIAGEDDGDDDKNTHHALKTHLWLRDKIGLDGADTHNEAIEAPFAKTPIFIGHGDEDTVVPTRLGRDAGRCLAAMHTQSEYHEYEGLAHWYNDVMLREFLEYLQSHSKGWKAVEQK